jgi:hypothetical protein
MPRRRRSERRSRYYLQGAIAPNLSTRIAVHGSASNRRASAGDVCPPDATPGTNLTHVCGTCLYVQEAEEAAPTVAELADNAK